MDDRRHVLKMRRKATTKMSPLAALGVFFILEFEQLITSRMARSVASDENV